MVDYCGLLPGAYLLGTQHLYSVPANLEVQQRLVGQSDPARVYPRLPWVAVLYKPFTALPFGAALGGWRLAMVLAYAAFLWLFPASPRLRTLAALSWSVPAFDGLTQGQDSPLLLVWIALALRLSQGGAQLAAGLVLSLCTAKYHLFLLLPFLVVAQRRWRMAAGLTAGTASLLGASFALQGWRWPLEYLAVITRPEINALPRIMPNFHGVFSGYREGLALELVAAMLTALIVILICRRSSFEIGLAASLLGGFLISHHAYIHDAVVLLPALMIVSVSVPSLSPLALALLAPFVPFSVNAVSAGRIAMTVLVGLLLAELYLAARCAPDQGLVSGSPGAPSPGRLEVTIPKENRGQ